MQSAHPLCCLNEAGELHLSCYWTRQMVSLRSACLDMGTKVTITGHHYKHRRSCYTVILQLRCKNCASPSLGHNEFPTIYIYTASQKFSNCDGSREKIKIKKLNSLTVELKGSTNSILFVFHLIILSCFLKDIFPTPYRLNLIFVVPCIMLNSEIIPTRCNNCVYSSQWLYSTCFG